MKILSLSYLISPSGTSDAVGGSAGSLPHHGGENILHCTGIHGENLRRFFDSLFAFPAWRQVKRYQVKRCNVPRLHKDNVSLARANFLPNRIGIRI
jgi:hypothetical protein